MNNPKEIFMNNFSALLLLDGSFIENTHRSTVARCSNENMKDTGGHLHLKVFDNDLDHNVYDV